MAKTALAIGAVAGALAGTYSAVSQDQAQGKARKAQGMAQQQAQGAALKQSQAADESIARANRKQPDLAAMLAQSQQTRAPSTLLTGSGMPVNQQLGL